MSDGIDSLVEFLSISYEKDELDLKSRLLY